MELKNLAQATAFVALVAGCATSTSVPKERIAASEAAVRTAEQMKQLAPATPEAEHHLKLAKEELRTAHDELEEGNKRRAEMMFIRARTDAELAQALAMTTKAESERNEMQTELDRVKASAPAATTAPGTGMSSSTIESTTTIPAPASGSVEIKRTETTTKKVEVKKKPGEQAAATTATPPIPDEHAENMTQPDSDD